VFFGKNPDPTGEWRAGVTGGVAGPACRLSLTARVAPILADKLGMISIKKLIDRAGEEALQATLDSYCSVLNAVGESGAQACPQVGNALRQNLLNLQAAISPRSTPDLLHQTGQKVAFSYQLSAFSQTHATRLAPSRQPNTRASS